MSAPTKTSPSPSAVIRRTINRALLAAGLTIVLIIVGSLGVIAFTERARGRVQEGMEELERLTSQDNSPVTDAERVAIQQQRIVVQTRRAHVQRLVMATGILQLIGLLAVLTLLFFIYRRLLPLTEQLKQTLDTREETIDRHESTELARQLMIDTLLTKNEELDHFAYIASHDLQEPLRTIRNFIEIIEEDFGKQMGEEGQTYLTFIHEATERMQRMITSLLNYSQLGKRSPRSAVDLEEVLAAVQADLAARFADTGGELTASPLPIIYGYESELYQLFQNLISNALKFCAPGDEPRVQVDCEEGDDYYLVSVSDQGIGMDDIAKSKIFQMFSRVNKPGEYEGYGIGLAFCRKIVELHGGVLSVESSPGHGSTFFFTLPNYIIRDATAD